MFKQRHKYWSYQNIHSHGQTGAKAIYIKYVYTWVGKLNVNRYVL